MSKPTTFLRATVAILAVAFIASCSGGAPPSALPQGLAPAQSAARQSSVPMIPNLTANPVDLAVTESSPMDVLVLDNHYATEHIVTAGITNPTGAWYDNLDNLYIANYSLPPAFANVTEYAANYGVSFTYTTGLSAANNVTTDASGNVYVADDGSSGSGVVEEFPQKNNTPVASCSTGLTNKGIAWDRTGGVFVAARNQNTGASSILRYRAGLLGCPTPITLPVLIGSAGGLLIDMNDNLVACDVFAGTVDIIPPPYTAVSSKITGATICANIALNATQTQIYIADPANNDVLVDNYPSGTNITTLNSVNGISSVGGGIAAYKQTTK